MTSASTEQPQSCECKCAYDAEYQGNNGSWRGEVAVGWNVDQVNAVREFGMDIGRSSKWIRGVRSGSRCHISEAAGVTKGKENRSVESVNSVRKEMQIRKVKVEMRREKSSTPETFDRDSINLQRFMTEPPQVF